jgi:hypothetical protein
VYAEKMVGGSSLNGHGGHHHHPPHHHQNGGGGGGHTSHHHHHHHSHHDNSSKSIGGTSSLCQIKKKLLIEIRLFDNTSYFENIFDFNSIIEAVPKTRIFSFLSVIWVVDFKSEIRFRFQSTYIV